ncbi:LysE family translocator [Leisingera methylohalidivorans]|uniref:Amino acid transporter n=1 Tax=Leisingera methylohalidivorans DSM 14336 TaxID=999552 RepID=V9W120_9RHOB|nr:LysE family translocator [Leisingera methylohalidivorans]AHD03689.1 amino acid transporter [Leisingera methylohalidivorans DSM 14336]
MPSVELLAAFFIATTVFAYMPGPGMFYAAAQTMAGGRKAGWFAALGMQVGGFFHVLAATFGLALVFAAVPVLYFALKIAGAAYLIWLGLKMLFDREPQSNQIEILQVKSLKRAFWESATVEILNPKTAIFFVAFLPQFTDPVATFPISVQLLLLGTFANLFFFSADVIFVALADRIIEFFKGSAAAGRLMKRLSGGLLVVLGLNVAFGEK